jgi:16S rRNA (guanine(966)-N(2))-methyltransferase RsmD
MAIQIAGGTQRGRRLRTPPFAVETLRPTQAKVRAALFNIIAPRLPGSTFLDLFAGTGAVGLEAIGRGAKTSYLVDNDPAALEVIRRNIRDLDHPDSVHLADRNVFSFLKEEHPVRFDLVFADPPYNLPLWPKLFRRLSRCAMIHDRAWIVIEHFHKGSLPSEEGRVRLVRTYEYGDTRLSLYHVVSEGAQNP